MIGRALGIALSLIVIALCWAPATHADSWDDGGTPVDTPAAPQIIPFVDGTAIATWFGSADVQGRLVNADAVAGTETITLFSAADGTISQLDALPIAPQTGLAIVVVTTAPSIYRIRARSVGSTGALGPQFDVSGDLTTVPQVSVSSAGDGTAVVTWIDDRADADTLYARLVSGSEVTSAAMPVDTVTFAEASSTISTLGVSSNSDGDTWVMWTELSAFGPGTLWVQELSGAAPVGHTTAVSPGDPWPGASALATLADGSAQVVWTSGGWWRGFLYTRNVQSYSIPPEEQEVNPANLCSAGSEGYSASGENCLASGGGSFSTPNFPYVPAIASNGDGSATVIARHRAGNVYSWHIRTNGVAESKSTLQAPSNNYGPGAVALAGTQEGYSVGLWDQPGYVGSTVHGIAVDPMGPVGRRSAFLTGGFPSPSIASAVTREAGKPTPVWATWYDASVAGISKVDFARFHKSSSARIKLSRMLSLGDSVSAGEGIGYGFRWKDDKWKGPNDGNDDLNDDWLGQRTYGLIVEPGKICHRTSDSYPQVLKERFDASLLHLACTGATGEQLLDEYSRDDTEIPAQLPGDLFSDDPDPSSPVATEHPEVVLLTVGANDVKFGDFVSDCYLFGCGGTGDDQLVANYLTVQKINLEFILDRINRDAGDVKPVVAVGKYYDPFPLKWEQCADTEPVRGISGLSSEELSWLRSKLSKLRSNIETVVNSRDGFGKREFPNAITVDLAKRGSDLDSHRWCGDDPWFFGPSIQANLLHWSGNPAPFHPTVDGQGAIADRFEEEIANFAPADTAATWANYDFADKSVRVKSPDAGNASPWLLRQVGGGAPSSSRFLAGAVSQADAGDATKPDLSGIEPQPRGLSVSAAYEFVSGDDTEGFEAEFFDVPEGEHAYQTDGTTWIELSEERLSDRMRVQLLGAGVVLIGRTAPAPSASFSVAAGCSAPCEAEFDASDSSVDPGSITSYEWDFGDGTTGLGETTSHLYSSGGTYQVSLKVTSDDGAVDFATGDAIVLSPKPTVTLAAPTSAYEGEPIDFVATAESGDQSAPNLAWTVDGTKQVDDGSTLRLTSLNAGSHRVDVGILNDSGESAMATATIEVRSRPSTESPALPTIATAGVTLRARTLRSFQSVRVPCTVSVLAVCAVELRLSTSQARQLGFKPKRGASALVLGSGRASAPPGVKVFVSVKLKRVTVRRLASSRKAITLNATLSANAGGQVLATKTTVKIRP